MSLSVGDIERKLTDWMHVELAKREVRFEVVGYFASTYARRHRPLRFQWTLKWDGHVRYLIFTNQYHAFQVVGPFMEGKYRNCVVRGLDKVAELLKGT